ncbi:MAG TPA: ATP-binding protein [Planctomycetota bacterium]|nr:ATP-binding protein [Planctomycetota bacterium]
MGEERVPENTAGLLHDLSNVVGGLGRLAENALRSLDPGHPAREDVLAIAAACGQAAELVREAVEGAPPPGGGAELNALAAGQVEVARRSHDARIRLMASKDPVRVRIAPAELRRVVDNLLANALYAVDGSEGEIVVRVGKAPQERALLEVRDTGRGMDAPTLARIFEPGFTTRQGRGHGLGLKVVKELVERHGGDVRVTSAIGLGTSVRILLPVAPPTRGSGTILIVDDHPEVRRSMKDVLTDSGYRVLEAGDAKGALRLLDAGVDLLLADMKLPDMDGADLAAAAAAARPGLKIALMSGYAWSSETGVEILLKPADPDELRDRVRAMLKA